MWACQIIPDCHTGPIHQSFFCKDPQKIYKKEAPMANPTESQNTPKSTKTKRLTSPLGKSLYKPPHKETKNDKTPGQSCLLVGDLLVLIQVHDHSLGPLLSPAWRARSLINVGALPSNVLEGFEGLYRRYYVICSPNINSKRLPIDPQGFC